jgi:cbb3-type cytochrome oxidase subunit 3
MISKIMPEIVGADFYMIISLLTFLIFFIGVLFYTFKTNEEYIDEMKNLPLNEQSKTKEVSHAK